MNKNIDLNKIFNIVILVSLLETTLYLLFFDLNGAYFYIGTLNTDPGGDFYLSLLFSRALNPYSYPNFPYPPFMVLICNFLGLFDRTDAVLNANLLQWEDTFRNIYSKSFVFRNSFYLLSNLLLILLFYFIFKTLKKSKTNNILLTSILLICNSGLFCALVRGNLCVF